MPKRVQIKQEKRGWFGKGDYYIEVDKERQLSFPNEYKDKVEVQAFALEEKIRARGESIWYGEA